MRVTMQQVADAAGVHRTTVSLALRHHPSIPPATRERIQAIAQELDYRPNPLVATLMSQLRTHRCRPGRSHEVIALINLHPPDNPPQRHPSLFQMLQGAQEQAARMGFALETFNLREPNMTSRRLRKILRARGVRALIFGTLPTAESVIDIDLDGFAAVSLGSGLHSPFLERIASDHYQCSQLAFENCLRLGYRRIALLIGESFSQRLENRWLSAFLSAQQQLPEKDRIPPLTHYDDLPRRLRNLRPDAIISPFREGWRNFQAMHGNVPVANLTRIHGDEACAGIDQNMYKVGAISVERVVSRLHQNSFGALEQMQNTFLHGTWVDGQSLPPKR